MIRGLNRAVKVKKLSGHTKIDRRDDRSQRVPLDPDAPEHHIKSGQGYDLDNIEFDEFGQKLLNDAEAEVYEADQENEATDKMLAGLRHAFSIFKEDMNTRIASLDLFDILQVLGEDVTCEECDKLIAQYGDNDESFVDFKGFAEILMNIISSDDTEEDVIEAFKMFDEEKSGMINNNELRRIMSHLGDKLTEEEIEEMLRMSNSDANGRINYADFTRQLMKTPDRQALCS